MSDAKSKPKPILLTLPQRQCLEGISNRRPQNPVDPVRDAMIELGLVAAAAGGKWALTAQGKKALAASSNKRNSGGFSV